MGSPNEDISAFLQSAGTSEAQRLEVAIIFAECMLRELRLCMFEWEQTIIALQDIRQRDRARAFD